MRDELARRYHYMSGGNPGRRGIIEYHAETGEFIVPDLCKTGTPLPLPSPLKRKKFKIKHVH
jgi:hypothetical protein